MKRLSSTAQQSIETAYEALDAGNLTKARREGDRAFALARFHPSALILIAEVVRAEGKVEEALAYYVQVLGMSLAEDEAWFAHANYAELQVEQGSGAQAIGHALKAIELQPEEMEPYLAAAQAYMLLKQPNNALYWLNEGLLYDESFVEGLLMRADLYVSAGNYSEARTDYAQAIDLAPHKPRPYLAFAQIATQMHDLDLAFNTLDEGLMTVPAEQRKPLHELRAYLLLKDGQLLDGLQELDALGSATDELPTWLLLARADARLDSDEIEDGLADFDLLLTREPSHPEALQGRLDALLALERRQEASTLLNQMIELTPLADLYNQRGDFFFEEDDLDAARKEYERAFELEPRHPLVSYNLALLLLEQEDAQSALPYLDLALEISPYDEERLRIRSRARRLAGLPYAAWLDADRAIKSDPEYVEGYVTRAEASIALKNEQDALKDLSIALELFPEYGDALAARAQLFTAMKRKKKALNDWKQYLALPQEEQDDEMLQEAMAIVAKG